MILSYSLSDQLLFLLAALQVLVVPGAIWTLAFKDSQRDIPEKIADSIAVSIAGLGVAAMLLFYLNWHVNTIVLAPVFILLDIVLFYLISKKIKNFSLRSFLWLGLTGLVLMGVIAFRFYQARDLVYPAWVDSVHHVLITQKFLDTGGIPQTLAPELDVPLYYHYGFHLVAALFSWISRLAPIRAVLWLGQVLNALVILGIYRLSKAIWKRTLPALLAALLVGFAFQMPAYYVTWGRYTLLAGLLVMLPAMENAYEFALEGFTWERASRLLVLTAGLILVHDLALYYYAVFLLSLLIERGVSGYRNDDPNERRTILIKTGKMSLAVLAGILLASPWLIRILTSHSAQLTVKLVVPNSENQNSYQYILFLLGPFHNYFLMGAALIGLAAAWVQKKTRALALWSSLLVLLSLPWGLKFGPFRPDHMAIILFIPAALLLSAGWVQLCDWIAKKTRPNLANGVLVVGALAVLGWGFWQTRTVVNPVTVLADQADWNGLEWIDQHTPADARFLTNTTIWQFQTYRGLDGGYWIIPQTGRFALALPGLYGYGSPDEKNQWISWMQQAAVVHACDDGFWRLVKDAKLNYVYLRDGKGSLRPEALVDCPDVDVVYQQDGVWIYNIHIK